MDELADQKPTHHRSVVARLQQLMGEAGLDALIAFKSENIQYVNVVASAYVSLGLPLGTAAVVIPRQGATVGVCTEAERANLSGRGMISTWIDVPAWIGIDDQFVPPERRKPKRERSEFVNVALNLAAVREALAACGVNGGRIGVELSLFPQALVSGLQAACAGMSLVEASPLFYKARAVKTNYEIECLRRAAHAQEEVISQVMREVQPGTSHAEVLARLRSRALARPEIDGIRFMFVSIGRHFEPTLIPYDTKIGQGDLIRYDGALIHAGYGADAARTFIAGRPSDDQRRIHECMIRAHEAALALMKPGVTPKEVFECGTRSVQEFLPNYMRGHIGHSVGLEQIVEEPPFISPRSTDPMVAGNTFCLELPYYAYEFGSIMVEDIVVITDYGHELLTNAPYALQPIGVA